MSKYAGLDDEIKEENTKAEVDNVVSMSDSKPKRRQFHYWKVGDTEIKLKLTAAMINKVEDKYRGKSIMSLVMEDDIPSLSVMLTIVQAAAIPWNHGTSYAKVQSLYDSWTENEGGNLTDFYTKIVLPTLAVSGFFTEETAQQIMDAVDVDKRLG